MCRSKQPNKLRYKLFSPMGIMKIHESDANVTLCGLLSLTSRVILSSASGAEAFKPSAGAEEEKA